MYIHNPISAIVYRAICLILCLYGIFLNLMPFSLSRITHMLSYYTILSNILCSVVFAVCIYISVRALVHNKFAKYGRTIIFFKGLATMSIIVSFIAYHYMLTDQGLVVNTRGLMIIDGKDFFVHYMVPFFTLGDWLLFQPKGLIKFRQPLIWLSVPMLYLGIVMAKSTYLGDYPYFFMNIGSNGYGTFIKYIACIGAICIVIGFLLAFADRMLYQISHMSKHR